MIAWERGATVRFDYVSQGLDEPGGVLRLPSTRGASAMAMPEHARRVSREGGDGIVRSRMANDLPRVTSIVVAVTLLARIAPCAAPGGGRPEAAGPDAARVP
jgi:hypothetical protein